MIKVSVIIPIYGTEKFIGKCATSLMNQTLNEVEFIFVDDCTKDRSIEILQGVLSKYPLRQKDIRIIHHKENQGLPAARNTGMSIAQGEFVFHCDSDDFVEPNMLEELYESAKNEEADFVWCDWWLSFEKNERYMKQPSFSSSEEVTRAMLGGGMKYNVWNKLIKRSLYTDYNIEFPAGYGMGEDMTIILLAAHAKRPCYVNKAYYHYVKLNTGAFSATISEKHMEAIHYNVSRICGALENSFGTKYEREEAFLKLEAKFPFLFINKLKEYHRWHEWYPEANQFIRDNKYATSKNRWLQWAASKHQYWLVWLHYWLVDQFIYGKIYK